MKKHNILKVVLISIFIVFLLSWIIPRTYYSTEAMELLEGPERIQLGLFNLFSYPQIVLSYFIHILFYVILCGGLYGVLYRIPAYKAFLEKIVSGFKGKESIFLVLVMVLLAALSSVCGFSLGFLVVFPMLISIILMMGYNKIVAASVTVGSVLCGMIGTTYGADTFSYVHSILETEATGDMLYKVIILALAVILLIFNVLRYAKKTKSQTSVNKGQYIPDTVTVATDKKVRIWPLVVIFDLMLIIMLLGVFPWSTVFPKFTVFTDVYNWVMEFEIFDFPIFAKILGDAQAFGEWGYALAQVAAAALPVMVILTTIVLALVYRLSFDKFLDGITDGMKKALKPAVIMSLIYMLLIISTYHPVQLYFVKLLLGLGKGLNVVIMSVIVFLGSFLNVEAMYTAEAILPYTMTVITDSSLYSIIAVIFQSIYGLGMLVLPSSIILMGTLSYLDISYGKWLKHIWKLFVEILIVLIVVFIIMLAV